MSYALVTMAFVMILLLFFELFSDIKNNVGGTATDFGDLVSVKWDNHLITAWYICLLGYSLQIMVFPTYAELEERSTKRFGQAYKGMLLLFMVMLVSVGVTCTLMFGETLESDFLLNMATREGSASMFIRVTYMLILNFHIPYYFFASKE